MKDRIAELERLIPKLKSSGKILPQKITSMEWELRSLKAEKLVKNFSIPLVMPCTSFEHTAVDLKDGSTAVWTDGLSLNSDNDRHCQYKLEGGQKYKVVLYKT